MNSVQRVTLESVAVHAGVSRQTVSNAINAPELVRADTLERVRACIKGLGYRPSTAARQLRTRRSRVLGFALPPARDGFNYAVGDRFIHALTEAAQLHGYRITLFTAGSDEQEIAQYEDLLHGADIDGLVLTNTHHGDPRTHWLGERDVPFVTFGRPWNDGQGGTAHPWVDVDGAAGTALAVEHLRSLGHERIAFLGWPSGSGVGDDRRAGWEHEMRAGGTSEGDLTRWRAEAPEDVALAGEIATRLVEDVAPTAIVCVSDSVALAVLNALRMLGRTAAVVGFDDTPAAAAVGLSSLAQPIATAATTALGLVLSQIGGPHQPATTEHVLLSPVLVERTSSDVAPTSNH